VWKDVFYGDEKEPSAIYGKDVANVYAGVHAAAWHDEYVRSAVEQNASPVIYA
jgi:hypothetical protein